MQKCKKERSVLKDDMCHTKESTGEGHHNIVAMCNVPRKIINALVQTKISKVYVYGYDVAYSKELARERMHLWKSICIRAWNRRS